MIRKPIAKNAAKRVALTIVMLTCFGAPFSGSPIVVVASGLALAAIVLLLWRPGEVPVLLVPAVYQWFAVALKPIQTVFTGQPLYRLADYGVPLDDAALFGLAGVVALSFGMAWASRPTPSSPLPDVAATLQAWPRHIIIPFSIGVIALGHFFNAISHFVGPARQLVEALAQLSLAGVFLLGYWCVARREALHYLAAVVAIEIIVGMTGFFADFRGTVMVLFLAVIAANPRIGPGGIALATVCAGAIGLLASFWQFIKTGYRHFLNAGTGEQVVRQPMGDRINFLLDATQNVTGAQLAQGFDELSRRQSYIDFLALALKRVPHLLPHTEGGQILQTFRHILMPRVLFPNKPATPHDTDLTAYYTGLDIANRGNINTSISLGYLGEFYIDFGYIPAVLLCIVFGAMIGFGYKKIRDFRKTPIVANYAFSTMLIMSILTFETALIKIVGGYLTYVVVVIATQRVAGPIVFKRLLSVRKRPSGHAGLSRRAA